MAKRLYSGAFLLFFLPFLLGSADKREKAYELIYKDVQILKQKVLQLDEKIERNAEDIRFIREQVKELIQLMRLFQSEQASAREDQKRLPAQFQILIEKLDSINAQLSRFSEDLIEIKRSAQPLTQQAEGSEQEGTAKTTPSTDGTEEQAEKESEDKESQPSITPNLSPNEIFNMARSDYLKGNYDLAVEGFTIYKTQFPESPLADDAIYWIGECYFSQKKYEDAIENFNELILSYPSGDKIPAGYLKKGISLTEQGKKLEALTVFRLLITKFPLEEETKIAQQKIRELESDDERY
ncbi:MAG: tol-pal system protein YbgF [Candidatus Aminicenantes bacterium]|nr:tol-pal system protein YbgF [Candidatus Aminicenantes bacterium]